jgi:hypothetical protein
MLRQQPVTAARWLSHCLLVLTAMAGLGFWYGDHCTDHTTTNHPIARPAAQVTAEFAATVSAHGGTVARPQFAPASISDVVSDLLGSTAAGDCHVSRPPAATGATVTTVHILPAAKEWGRPAATDTARPAVHRCCSRRALTELEISRT